MKRKLMLVILALALLTSVLSGCAKEVEAPTEKPAAPAETEAPVVTEAPAETEAPMEEPALPAEVDIAIGADPADLSPFVGMSMGRIAVLKTIYEYLIEVDSMGGKAVPMIAKSWEKTGDKLYKVTIFDNVFDSAGNHITAADVAWSYNTAKELGNLRPLGDIVSFTAVDDLILDLEVKANFGPGGLEKVLAECPIVSQAAYESSADSFATKPITTGAYVLTEYVPGSSLTFERRADYWQTDPEFRTLFSQANVEKIVFKVITEAAQNAIALETANVDIAAGVTQDDLPNFLNNPAFTTFNFLDNLTQNLQFNGSDGHALTNKELRQAIAYAIDTSAMCEAVAPGACTPAHTIGNPNFGGYLKKWESEPYYEFDLAKAKELFAASGHAAGELTFKLLAQNDARSGLMAQIIQAQLAELGIAVEINQVESAVYNQIQYDPTAYDLLLAMSAGGDFIFSPWQLVYDQNRYNGTTSNFFKDDELQALLVTVSSLDGFNEANVDAFQQYQKEQLYAYGMLSFNSIIVADSGVLKVVRDTRGQVIPGACEYAVDFNK
ncbi:MAG TPA: ABC transporter substrate-binding protein [Anaerolineaceae bacterium]|jgi:ABC-type transport system substrate-binding protein|nr:ABC transporter substrate-binding protein [Anaerolineaceae bacterium]HQC21870.1 ABC transporter substrate-binding protein [Anaerolineaceae bacterium]